MRVLTEFNPPFNFDTRDGASGIATDLFLHMTDRAGLDLERKGHPRLAVGQGVQGDTRKARRHPLCHGPDPGPRGAVPVDRAYHASEQQPFRPEGSGNNHPESG